MPFSGFGLHAEILRGIKDLAFTNPTPIQKEAIGPAMAGRDVLACAATGSGKTAAFMLPIIHRLMTKAPAAGPRRARVLVLTPTRELAMQILEHLNAMAVYTPVSGAAIIGGVSMGPQAHAFRTGVEILIATPGRLLDHMRQAYARLDGLEVLVMDEADRMLDMGFLPDIRRILQRVPAKRQTLFFSATMPTEIRQLMQEMLKDPVAIQMERQAAPAAGITQAIYPVAQSLKTLLLCKLLENEELESVICFTRTKQRANRLARSLSEKGIACVPIHGNRSQGQRTAALKGFKGGQFRVLVATDIAARGIDIADVSHVINFDCPHLADDYIHRVGRTGRAAAVGDAFTFVSGEEEGNLRAIERAIGKRLPRVTLPDFDYGQKVMKSMEAVVAERIEAIKKEKAKMRGRGEFGGPGRGGFGEQGSEKAPREGHGGQRGGQGGQGGHGGGMGQRGHEAPGRPGQGRHGEHGGRQGGGWGQGKQGGQGGGTGQGGGGGSPALNGPRAQKQNTGGRGKFGHVRGPGKYHGPAGRRER